MWTPDAVSRSFGAEGGAPVTRRVGVEQAAGDVNSQVEGLVLLGRTWAGNCWYALLTVGGICCSALVDTGSSATLVRPDVVKNRTTILPTSFKIQTVTGEQAPMVGETLVVLDVGKKSVRCRVWVADLEDCILGLDVLEALDCVINVKQKTLTFPDGHVVQMSRRPPQPGCPVAHTVTVETLTTVAASSSSTVEQPILSLTTPTTDRHSQPAPPVLPSTLPATDLQPQPAPPVLAFALPAAGLQPQPVSATLPEGEKRVLAVREVWKKNCDGLSAGEQDLLWQLLLEFKDCFSLSEDDVGHTDLIQHDIITGDAQPIRMRPRRLPLARQAVADKALQEMQWAGLIEPSTSPWASPVVIVPKKTKDEWRFCVDFRSLNKITKKDPYLLPRIDEALDAVAGSSWFSSLDLRSGYWQVPLAPEARPKSAFITSRGLWQFKVLPFGLCNAPATFERVMDRVLAGIPRQECGVYLDDILVHGHSFEPALRGLRSVLERVAGAGLKLHPQKCCFMRHEVTFLGHRLGNGGVSTVKEKVEAVYDWPTQPLYRISKVSWVWLPITGGS